MRLLTRSQITRRLLLFGALAVAFTAAVVAVEFQLGAERPVSFWTVIAAALGLSGIWTAVVWFRSDHGPQGEWQPRLFSRALAGGFAFQAGIIGYFVATDLVAAVVGCVTFVAVLAIVIAALGHVEYGEVGADG